jgi:preprotein translocase subunit SecG
MSEGMPIEVKWGISFLVAAGLIYVGWKYTPILVALHVLVCFILVLVIMLQSGSAADLAGAFGGAGSQTAFGPRGAATFLSKATTWCAIVFMLTSLTLSIKRTPTDVSTGSSSILEQTTKTAPAAPAKPATPPASAPANSTPQPATQAPAPAPAPSKPPAQTPPLK